LTSFWQVFPPQQAWFEPPQTQVFESPQDRLVLHSCEAQQGWPEAPQDTQAPFEQAFPYPHPPHPGAASLTPSVPASFTDASAPASFAVATSGIVASPVTAIDASMGGSTTPESPAPAGAGVTSWPLLLTSSGLAQ
jgi:hypothetical protein